MSGSVAEERIRAKAEGMLRKAWPEARIVHELVLEQGGCRIDVAAVTPDQIIACEIKSERDTLKRLAEQVRSAVRISNVIWLCAAAKHAPAIDGMTRSHLMDVKVPFRGGYTFAANPTYLPELRHCKLYIEAEDGGLNVCQHHFFYPDRNRPLAPAHLLSMLWAEELRNVCRELQVSPKATRSHCIARACEMMTGREIRLAVCRELLTRPFPRADELRSAAELPALMLVDLA